MGSSREWKVEHFFPTIFFFLPLYVSRIWNIERWSSQVLNENDVPESYSIIAIGFNNFQASNILAPTVVVKRTYWLRTVHVTLTRHSCMGVFQIGSSLPSKRITDFEWRNFVENEIWNRNNFVENEIWNRNNFVENEIWNRNMRAKFFNFFYGSWWVSHFSDERISSVVKNKKSENVCVRTDVENRNKTVKVRWNEPEN